MTDAEILAEVRKLDARWRECFDFSIHQFTRMAISACGADLRDVLAGKRVDELRPAITDEDRRARAEAMTLVPPELLAKMRGDKPS
jgi:hypothetical protein